MTATTTKKYLRGKEAREWADQMKRDKEEQKNGHSAGPRQADMPKQQDHQGSRE